jgi:hypothetical protein
MPFVLCRWNDPFGRHPCDNWLFVREMIHTWPTGSDQASPPKLEKSHLLQKAADSERLPPWGALDGMRTHIVCLSPLADYYYFYYYSWDRPKHIVTQIY